MTLPRHIEQFIEDAERFYADTYKAEFEAKHRGKFAAIDLKRRRAFIGADEMDAINQAKAEDPDAFVYMVRIGFPTAVEFGYAYKP
jgi:hypothetical protein